MSCKSFIQHVFNNENYSFILLLTAYNVYYMQLDFFHGKSIFIESVHSHVLKKSHSP
jgi:hypothetical protein